MSKDGGPAFPEMVTDLEYHYESETRWPNTYSHGGMTLRDYFAAAALQGFCAHGGGMVVGSYVAEHAYRVADDMLKAKGE